MKRINDVIDALDAKEYDEDTVKDAVMYLGILQGLMKDVGQYFEYYGFWNKEELDDYKEHEMEQVQCRSCKNYILPKNKCNIKGADVGNPYDEHDCVYYEYEEE